MLIEAIIIQGFQIGHRKKIQLSQDFHRHNSLENNVRFQSQQFYRQIVVERNRFCADWTSIFFSEKRHNFCQFWGKMMSACAIATATEIPTTFSQVLPFNSDHKLTSTAHVLRKDFFSMVTAKFFTNL